MTNFLLFFFLFFFYHFTLSKTQRVSGSEREREDFSEEKRKEHDSGRQKMAIGVAFNFLNIVGIREARNWKRVPQTRSLRKEAIIIEHAVTSR